MVEKTVLALISREKRIATAESCTGGLLASMITDIAGASSVFELGVVSYSNEVKRRLLGVPQEILESFGAVSYQTAEAMAKGVCELNGADYGVGITGIAGPGGGTPEKPVGLVYFSIYCAEKKDFITRELRLKGTRRQIREETCRLVFEELSGLLGIFGELKGETRL